MFHLSACGFILTVDKMKRPRSTCLIFSIFSTLALVFHKAGYFIDLKKSRYCGKIEGLTNPVFTSPEDIVATESELCVGLVLIQNKKEEKLAESFRMGVTKMLDSVFKHTKESLHLIILTDRRSVKCVGKFLAEIVMKTLGTQAILSRSAI